MSGSADLSSAADAEQAAERLRGELASTLDRLGDNLMPDKLAAEAAAAVADRTPAWLKDYWALARGPVGLGLVGATAASIAVALLARRLRH